MTQLELGTYVACITDRGGCTVTV